MTERFRRGPKPKSTILGCQKCPQVKSIGEWLVGCGSVVDSDWSGSQCGQKSGGAQAKPWLGVEHGERGGGVSLKDRFVLGQPRAFC